MGKLVIRGTRAEVPQDLAEDAEREIGVGGADSAQRSVRSRHYPVSRAGSGGGSGTLPRLPEENVGGLGGENHANDNARENTISEKLFFPAVCRGGGGSIGVHGGGFLQAAELSDEADRTEVLRRGSMDGDGGAGGGVLRFFGR